MSVEFLGERRRALEEEYFAKLNRMLMDQLRANEDDDRKANEGERAAEIAEVAPSGVPMPGSSVVELGGLRAALRQMHPDDASRYAEFLARVDEKDLRLRFGRDSQTLRADPLGGLTRRGDDLVVIATVVRDGADEEIVGDARARTDPHPYDRSAEFAIIVRSDLQGRGLGSAMLETLIQECRARGVERLYGVVDSSNDAMLALAQRVGFGTEHVPDGSMVVVSLELEAQPSRAPRHSASRRRETLSHLSPEP